MKRRYYDNHVNNEYKGRSPVRQAAADGDACIRRNEVICVTIVDCQATFHLASRRCTYRHIKSGCQI